MPRRMPVATESVAGRPRSRTQRAQRRSRESTERGQSCQAEARRIRAATEAGRPTRESLSPLLLCALSASPLRPLRPASAPGPRCVPSFASRVLPPFAHPSNALGELVAGRPRSRTQRRSRESTARGQSCQAEARPIRAATEAGRPTRESLSLLLLCVLSLLLLCALCVPLLPPARAASRPLRAESYRPSRTLPTRSGTAAKRWSMRTSTWVTPVLTLNGTSSAATQPAGASLQSRSLRP